MASCSAAAATLAFTVPCRATDAPSAVRDPVHPPLYVDVDATLLNAGVSIAGHVGSGVYVGAGFSFLPALTVNTFDSYPIEYAEGHGFVRYAPLSALQIDMGVRAAAFEEFHICVFSPCDTPPSATLFGPYADLRFGFPHFKIGPRVAYAVRSDTGEWGALFYPLFLRVQFTP